MSKRRISKQQSTRIEKIQQDYHQHKKSDAALIEGLVITRFSKHVEVEDNEGNHIRCSIRPNLETLVAGDKVIWQMEGKNQGVVVSLYPRSSLLAKPTSAGLKKPVAANITQLVIVIATKPETSWPLLDSYLVMAETLQLHAVILLNKTDLPCEPLKEQLFGHYDNLDYPILLMNQHSSTGLEQLKQVLNHQISVFVGQSGVGKSSLIARILPHEQNIATKELSEISELGQHTTSNSRYYHLPSGGALIDSPGVREFSLWHIDMSEITRGYIEFRPYLSQCKFRNCTHKDTPHCAIIHAVTKGLISTKRYENFIKLCAQYDSFR
ncbi:small ribosomal subunit biogenesis GTPase RsgA [Legionella longbeachae]|uniref:Small ribosomal subunit biogenesis GTPase RsgA n=1 Tax=Legionella longbeachae serogroup 1 (strain NSW150) TaxID=661367 RepID=D3HP24_LEGLN|nr:small ribosomal subunit biogenesis GTPase RsgA [Legionella longbeachae]VEE01164.1 ribosome small subunit-dependent GTPase A [Legionella oakridgensis]ARB92462.1 small ribosomal subunit biogenesis GTPase RsgA [Legionella longbeachae]EEZ96360.1 ribosome small subunit-dependent GTPase A [Legionella longbeachae D-4968]QIN31117.1 small ribosomal subunit biogenesis GTPase RsgA [Legionella longbeachae]QIN34474.1 small ribosomal subunit biogenesis GTPase RsgA [Legionella longbeachae]